VAGDDWSGRLESEERAGKDVASTYVLCPRFVLGPCFRRVGEI